MAQYDARKANAPVDVDLEEDRYSRLRLIPWWEQDRLAAARVMVVGAGAIGNELCKNLALLGIGNVFVVDLDTIEDTNLTRSVLFTHEDAGHDKALVAAQSMRRLNPDVRVEARRANILHDIGAGVFRDMDIVLGGLDNREARLFVNQVCWKLGKPWIDGAIEVVHGLARGFYPPDGPCYECTLTDLDYKLLNMRRSCALLTRDDVLEGKVPTTPTTASVIGGIQVQEAVKWLHRDRDLPLLSGKGFVFNGLTHDSYVVQYRRRDECPAHDDIGPVLATDFSAATATLGELLGFVRERIGPEAVLEFDREICTALHCPLCDVGQEVFAPLGKLTGKQAACPRCGQARLPQSVHAIHGDEPYLGLTLAQFGIPPYDIVRGRRGMRREHYLLSADRRQALGAIA